MSALKKPLQDISNGRQVDQSGRNQLGRTSCLKSRRKSSSPIAVGQTLSENRPLPYMVHKSFEPQPGMFAALLKHQCNLPCRECELKDRPDRQIHQVAVTHNQTWVEGESNGLESDNHIYFFTFDRSRQEIVRLIIRLKDSKGVEFVEERYSQQINSQRFIKGNPNGLQVSQENIKIASFNEQIVFGVDTVDPTTSLQCITVFLIVGGVFRAKTVISSMRFDCIEMHDFNIVVHATSPECELHHSLINLNTFGLRELFRTNYTAEIDVKAFICPNDLPSEFLIIGTRRNNTLLLLRVLNGQTTQ